MTIFTQKEQLLRIERNIRHKMDRKKKGSDAERELIHLFWQQGWAALRAAGSGSMQYPCCDVLAGNGQRRLAIECKITSDEAKYFDKEELDHLSEFAQRFGAEPWIGIRFFRSPWYFLSLQHLKSSGKLLSITRSDAEQKGRAFEQLITFRESQNTGSFSSNNSF